MPPFYELGGSVANTGEPWSQQRRRRCVRRDRPGHAARKPDSHQRASLSQGVGIPPYSGLTNGTMRTIFVVVTLALLTIAFEIYSEAALMGRAVPHAGPDPATLAIAHAAAK